MQVFLISALVFSLLVAVFAVQNAILVPVNLLFWNFQISLVLVILSASVAGAFIMFFVALFRQFNLGQKIKEYEARVKVLEGKIAELEGKVRETQVPEGP
ncbi:MAG TPA: DUF1049 domain-containing protein [Firmicutes bacterium]|nr:DUF1049 domain-containing protein [Bacillota bacterium]HWR55071.1 LapA family protein [Negativicutes bacterium]